jgi:antitoxin CptB
MPDDQNSADLDTRRRRARFRSWHRGMREMDLVLGRFADERMERLNAAELDQYEALLEIPDGDLLKWVTGEQPAPADVDTPLFQAIRATAAEL